MKRSQTGGIIQTTRLTTSSSYVCRVFASLGVVGAWHDSLLRVLDFGCIHQDGNRAGEEGGEGLKQLDEIVMVPKCIFIPKSKSYSTCACLLGHGNIP
jgi:hypothetical protein